MSLSERWINGVYDLNDQVNHLFSSPKDLEILLEAEQEWFLNLLEQSRKDIIRLREAVSGMSASRRGVSSKALD